MVKERLEDADRLPNACPTFISIIMARPSEKCGWFAVHVILSVSQRVNNGMLTKLINLLKPTGYVMHQQFNIQQL